MGNPQGISGAQSTVHDLSGLEGQGAWDGTPFAHGKGGMGFQVTFLEAQACVMGHSITSCSIGPLVTGKNPQVGGAPGKRRQLSPRRKGGGKCGDQSIEIRNRLQLSTHWERRQSRRKGKNKVTLHLTRRRKKRRKIKAWSKQGYSLSRRLSFIESLACRARVWLALCQL
jgi:hypothetical protein